MEDKKVVPARVGRPCTVELNEAEGETKQLFRNCNSESSVFSLQDMKEVYAKKRKEKAEADGINGDSVDCHVCHNTAKSTMVALAMKGSAPTLTKKKLQIKSD